MTHPPRLRPHPILGTLVLAAIIWAPVVWWLAGCSTAQGDKALASQAGQLFCSIQTTGGGAVVVAVANAAAAGVAGPAAPLAVIATGASKAFVDAACARAAAALAAPVGVPVPPPATVVPVVPIVPPADF